MRLNDQAVLLAAVLLAATGCSAPTLQQRQDNWRRLRDVTRATCVVGAADPAQPVDVRQWCSKVSE